MTAEALLALGFAVMVLGDRNLLLYGEECWLHLDEKRLAIYGDAKDDAGKLFLSAMCALPFLGMFFSSRLYRSTVQAAIGTGIPDLVLAVFYALAFAIVTIGPNHLVERAGMAYSRRLVSAPGKTHAASSTPAARKDAEVGLRLLIAVGFVLVGAGFSKLAGLPVVVGVVFGLFLLKERLAYRSRQLKKCRQIQELRLSAIPSE